VILALFTAATANAVEIPETAHGHIAEERSIVQFAEADPSIDTEAIVRSYFADIPIMIEVARCESTFRHTLADGSVLQGRVDPDDTGVMQINKFFHEETAVAMQLNLDDIYHNMAYARYLYERQGTQPWSASMPCWGGALAMNL
jgi:hypothetical protein